MAGDAPNKQPGPTLRHRRLVISANVLVQVIAVAALVGLVNWFGYRHPDWFWPPNAVQGLAAMALGENTPGWLQGPNGFWQPTWFKYRFDWTRSGYYQLSEKTKQVLRSLKSPVRVVVFLPPGDQREYVEKVLQDTRQLLQEFQILAKDNLPVEYVDPQRDLARAKQLVDQYKLDSPDVVIFDSGERNKFVRVDDLVDLEYQQFGQGVRVKGFKGEGVFLAAIQTVVEEKPPQVYFLTGHGERDPENVDPREGYSMLASYLKRDNLNVAKWNWQPSQTWPADAGVVVVAGPRTPFRDEELKGLDDYLANRGRLLVMLDPRAQTGLETFLARWEVQVDDNLVVSPLLGMINVTALGDDYGKHPITAKLAGVNTSFPYARSVRRLTPAEPRNGDQLVVTELVKTPDSFWGESDYAGDRYQFTAARDLPGPVSLAVAVESRKPGGVELDVKRIVVTGCSSFVDNGNLREAGGNVDFLMNALNWLLHREQLIAVAPKAPEEFGLNMSPAQESSARWLVMGGLPLAVAVIGMVVWVRRRK